MLSLGVLNVYGYIQAMLWRIFIISWSLCLVSTNLLALEYKLKLKKTIPVENGYFTTDPIGNFYLVRDNNFIVKYNAQGDSLGVFNDISSGAVSMIDASNPLRVLVFYSGFSRIKILDNLLSLKNELDLSRINLFNVPAIANSMDGNIWVYDPSGTLLKIDDRLEIKHSYLLRNMIDFSINPSHMVERDRALYLTDSTEGILQFDRFGFYKTIYRFTTAEVAVMNNYIVYYHKDTLNSYNIKSLRASEIVLPKGHDIINARLEKNQIYILRTDGLEIYTLSQS